MGTATTYVFSVFPSLVYRPYMTKMIHPYKTKIGTYFSQKHRVAEENQSRLIRATRDDAYQTALTYSTL